MNATQHDESPDRVCRIGKLEGSLKHYAWGGATNIAALEDRRPTGQPEAERWYGTHPAGPTTLHGEDLAAAIQRHRSCALGPKTDRDSLPFLVKLLDSAQPLSLQVHPSREEARAGFEKEVAEDTPAAIRNYRDPDPKPEVIIAITELVAVSGFKSPLQIATVIRELCVPALSDELEFLESAQNEEFKLQAIMKQWLASDHREKAEALWVACDNFSGSSPSTTDFVDIARSINRAFPGDVGLLVALLLNTVKLLPGEALYTPANTLHAYVHGFGLEVMAPSDNVLRCAMTTKRKDIPELMRLVNFTPSQPEIFNPFRQEGYRADGFHVQMFNRSARISSIGPRIAVVTKGTVEVEGHLYEPGDAIWIPHSAGAVDVTTLNAEFALISPSGH